MTGRWLQGSLEGGTTSGQALWHSELGMLREGPLQYLGSCLPLEKQVRSVSTCVTTWQPREVILRDHGILQTEAFLTGLFVLCFLGPSQ